MTLRRERRDYGLYLLGQNTIYSLVTTYLVTYLLMCGISPVKSASVMLAVKVWDAVNDALSGALFDKVKFKRNNKFLPWLRISLPFIPLFTVALYAIPSFHGLASAENYKLLWFAVAYLLWDVAYTLCDIPIYGMITTMTNNLRERSSIQAYSTIYGGVGGAVAVFLGNYLVSQKVGLSFSWVAVIIACVSLVTMLPICLRGRERNYTKADREQEFSLREMVRYLFSNRYLLLYYGSFILSGSLGTHTALGLFTSYYLFGNELFNIVLGLLSAIPTLVMALIMPHWIKRADKFKLLYGSIIANVLLGFIIFFVGYRNPTAFLVLSVLRSVPLCIGSILLFMFTPDCAEYGRYVSGTDARGITFAIQTFSAKMTSSISGSLGVFVLGYFGWKAVEADSFEKLEALTQAGFAQSPAALQGLWITYALIPVLGQLISLFLLSRYRLSDKAVQIMARCNTGEISKEEAEALLAQPGIRKFKR